MVYPTLENYIKKSGLNKTEIARRTGTPASTFYAKLAGESDISLEFALKVKEVVGADESVEDLFRKSEPTPAV